MILVISLVFDSEIFCNVEDVWYGYGGMGDIGNICYFGDVGDIVGLVILVMLERW